MKNLIDSKIVTIAGVVALGGVLFYFFGRKLAADAVDAVKNVNAGTPYEGWGAVGTVGNLTNRLSGGVLQRIGESEVVGDILDPVFDFFTHTFKPYDPNNPNTPMVRKAATYASPVRPEDAQKISVTVN
jgi:hypothetical protein